MKKFLLFLLLFAAGLSILRWIEEPVAETRADGPSGVPEPEASQIDLEALPVAESSDETPQPDAEPPAEPPKREGFDTAARIRLSGKQHYRRDFEGGPRDGEIRYQLDSVDGRSLEGGRIELVDVTAVVYSEEDGSEVLRIEAGIGRARLRQADGGIGGAFELDDEVELEDVHCTLLRRVPIAPVTLRAPSLSGSLEVGEFSTDGEVEILGRGLLASGVGFQMVADSGLIRFERDGRAQVETELGRRGTLTSDGPLAIRESEDGVVVVDARENALLQLSGDDELSLAGEQIAITGNSLTTPPDADGNGDEETLGFERIDADGGVTLRLKGGEFESDEARIELADENARRFRAQLSGEPHGVLRFSPPLEEDEPAPLPGRVFVVRVRGAGPLVVERAERLGFRLPGPAELDWRGAALSADGIVSGTFGPAPGEAEITARDSVAIVRPDGSLETELFRLRHTRDADGASFVTATAAGPARMEGDADPEHSFVLTTGRDIDIVVDREVWRVPRTADVELVVDGPEGFRATAREIVDFSEDPLELLARGGVEVEAPNGTLSGDRLSLRGVEHVVVEGTESEPAVFTSELGRLTAKRVERIGTKLVAEQVSRAAFAHGSGAYDLGCERLVLEQLTEPQDDGAVVERLLLQAEGAVDGTATVLDDTYEVACGLLEGEYAQRTRGGVFLFARTAFRGSDAVQCALDSETETIEFRCDEVELEYVDRDEEVLSASEVVARGNVDFSYAVEDTELNGSGNQLEIDSLRRATLSASDGGRVNVYGFFKGSGYPYAMTAKWVHFSEVFLEADKPSLEMQYGSADTGRGVGSITATCDRLERLSDSAELTGHVRIQGLDGTKKWWRLDADRATLDGLSVEERGLFGGLKASGDVAFEMQDSIRAEGDEFAVRTTQQRLRIEGTPARLLYEGVSLESSWIEYDLLVHLIRSGEIEATESGARRVRGG